MINNYKVAFNFVKCTSVKNNHQLSELTSLVVMYQVWLYTEHYCKKDLSPFNRPSVEIESRNPCPLPVYISRGPFNISQSSICNNTIPT